MRTMTPLTNITKRFLIQQHMTPEKALTRAGHRHPDQIVEDLERAGFRVVRQSEVRVDPPTADLEELSLNTSVCVDSSPELRGRVVGFSDDDKVLVHMPNRGTFSYHPSVLFIDRRAQ